MAERALAPYAVGGSYLSIDGAIYPLVDYTLPEINWSVHEPGTGVPTSRTDIQIGEPELGKLILSVQPQSFPPLAKWVLELGNSGHHLLDLEVLRTDLNGTIQEGFRLAGCVLTELHFPPCSATQKDLYVVRAALQPERIAALPPGTPVKPPIGVKQRPWLVSTFGLSVDGLPTSAILKIDALDLTRDISARRVGEQREPLTYYGVARCSPLVLTIGGRDYPAWRDFALKQLGSGVPADARGARLSFLDASLKQELGSLKFSLAGLAGFQFARVTSRGDEAAGPQGVARLPVRDIALDIPPAAP